MNKKVKVIYIAGEGRSGSTLLERLLGQHPHIFAAGELKYIWDRSFIYNQKCSCGEAFSDCPVWKEIVKLFRKYQGNFSPAVMLDSFDKVGRIRHYLLRSYLKKRKYVNLINETYYNLYKAIHEVTGRDFIVDASKHPVFAHILSQNNKIELYLIHLVRHPCGVAFSWTKKKVRPEITNRREYMPRYSILRTAISWNVVNLISLKLSRILQDKYKRIFYEQLVNKPRSNFREILKFLGVDYNFDPFLDENTVILEKNHTVSGNPMRFRTGKLTLYQDIDWIEKMPNYKKFLVKCITWPIKRKLYKS